MIRIASRLTPVAVSDVTDPGITSLVEPQISEGAPLSVSCSGQLLTAVTLTQQRVRGRREEMEVEVSWPCWMVSELVVTPDSG